ncbi:hypothetical protein GCM10010172_35100 [Paractinoplanes ferrugineus]|uniref:Uncharacterized protein n=1 Tax=Paractinoplanes ferrugineus TaxID=113564 RepID=A0A919J924_9ACTN|nr:hypothetical protein Afe05nite_86200 [Actinoplanes ferrugineus]
MSEAERFEIGDEVDVTFEKSIVTGVRRWRGGCAITVLTADTEFSFDVQAVDTTVTRTGVRHDLLRCLQCGHSGTHCIHASEVPS